MFRSGQTIIYGGMSQNMKMWRYWPVTNILQYTRAHVWIFRTLECHLQQSGLLTFWCTTVPVNHLTLPTRPMWWWPVLVCVPTFPREYLNHHVLLILLGFLLMIRWDKFDQLQSRLTVTRHQSIKEDCQLTTFAFQDCRYQLVRVLVCNHYANLIRIQFPLIGDL